MSSVEDATRFRMVAVLAGYTTGPLVHNASSYVEQRPFLF